MGKSMIEIKRKDLPLKGFITTFESKLNEPEMDKQIKKVIDKYGDRQNHKTNVKAQMTEWKMWDNPGFNALAVKVLKICQMVSKEKYNANIEPILNNLWGMNYTSEEYTLKHDHWPSLWSFVYYVDVPQNAPGLSFPQEDSKEIEIKVHNGLLLMFEGHLKHQVNSKKFSGNRYVVSGNLTGYLTNMNINSNQKNYQVQ